jgi:hypothetical protein
MSMQPNVAAAGSDESTDWLRGRLKRIAKMEWWRWFALVAAVLLVIVGLTMMVAGALIVLRSARRPDK